MDDTPKDKIGFFLQDFTELWLKEKPEITLDVTLTQEYRDLVNFYGYNACGIGEFIDSLVEDFESRTVEVLLDNLLKLCGSMTVEDLKSVM